MEKCKQKKAKFKYTFPYFEITETTNHNWHPTKMHFLIARNERYICLKCKSIVDNNGLE